MAIKRVVTAEDVRGVAPGGELWVPAGAVVTAWASEIALSRGVRIVVAPPGARTSASVAIGADHGGYELKEALKQTLTRLGHSFRDFGTFSTDPVDYPDVAAAVARAVRRGEARFGILADGAGIGSAMAANKIRGIRAAACHDVAGARNAREHNDAQVLTLGSRFVDPAAAAAIVEAFLAGRCTEQRHLRRVRKIEALEEGRDS